MCCTGAAGECGFVGAGLWKVGVRRGYGVGEA